MLKDVCWIVLNKKPLLEPQIKLRFPRGSRAIRKNKIHNLEKKLCISSVNFLFYVFQYLGYFAV